MREPRTGNRNARRPTIALHGNIYMGPALLHHQDRPNYARLVPAGTIATGRLAA
jgi:hypothetical protein